MNASRGSAFTAMVVRHLPTVLSARHSHHSQTAPDSFHKFHSSCETHMTQTASRQPLFVLHQQHSPNCSPSKVISSRSRPLSFGQSRDHSHRVTKQATAAPRSADLDHALPLRGLAGLRPVNPRAVTQQHSNAMTPDSCRT